jgi:RND superfamily putative drug exporter
MNRRSIADRYAAAIVWLRWWVIAFWLLTATACVVLLPTLSGASSSDTLRGLLPDDAPAIQNEQRSIEIFGFPLLGRTALVQRDPSGLSLNTKEKTLSTAIALNRGRYDDVALLEGALPISNTLGLFPSSSELGTTAVTYFFVEPGPSFNKQARAAEAYGQRFFEPADAVVGVTGSVPARAAQGRIIREELHTVETATLAAIVVIVGVYFRSIVAPIVTLATTAVAYLVTLRVSGYVASVIGVSSPSELEPVVIALLLGVVTDYVVFYCAALRPRLVAGMSAHDAARAATAQFTPIIAAAGLAVAAGTGALLVAESTFFRALGPALVFTVLTALTVAVTLVPALMAVLGRVVFWPSRLVPAAVDLPTETGGDAPAPPPRSRTLIGRLTDSRRSAGLMLAATTAALVVVSLPLRGIELGVSFTGALPPDNDVARAAAAAQAGFASGILSPTELLVEAPGLDRRPGDLAQLGRDLAAMPGVAGVLGPGDRPPRLELGVLLDEGGEAARYLVVLDDPALGASAIKTTAAVQQQLPALLERSGLNDAEAGLIGDSATGAYIVELTKGDLLRTAVAALLANLLMLVIFLRALVAPVMLLAATALSVAATLGATTWVFEQLDPGAGLVFYVPFAAAVLLLAFGSDYNIFGVGYVWDEARRRPLREAIAVAMPQTTRPITAAGLALAASFGMLALVPLDPFRQLAFAMSVGIALDVLVVRSLLMPALLVTVGPVSAWPSRRLQRAEAAGSRDAMLVQRTDAV